MFYDACYNVARIFMLILIYCLFSTIWSDGSESENLNDLPVYFKFNIHFGSS